LPVRTKASKVLKCLYRWWRWCKRRSQKRCESRGPVCQTASCSDESIRCSV